MIRRVLAATLAACAGAPPAPVSSSAEPAKPEAKEQDRFAPAIVGSGDLVLGGVTIRGPCYDTARHAAILNETTDFPKLDLTMHVDLDGDGTDDEMLFMGATGMRIDWEVYLRRGSCGYYLGRLSTDAGLEVTMRKTNGLYELAGRRMCPTKCCAQTPAYRYAFDGKTYAVVETWTISKTCPGPAP